MNYQEKWKKIIKEKLEVEQKTFPKYNGISIPELNKEELQILVFSLLEAEPYGFSFNQTTTNEPKE